jgi:hypothetical protein
MAAAESGFAGKRGPTAMVLPQSVGHCDEIDAAAFKSPDGRRR